MYQHQSGTYTVKKDYHPFGFTFFNKEFKDIRAKYIYEKDEYWFEYKDGNENRVSILKWTNDGWKAIDDVTDQEFAEVLGKTFDVTNHR